MKKALITGITGQDGSYLAEFLLEKGYQVHGVVRRSSTNNLNRISHLLESDYYNEGLFKIHFGDLSNYIDIIRILKEVEPDEVYNLAAQSHVGISFKEPEYTADINALGTLRMLEALRVLGLKDTKFYQASTSELFGKVKEIPQNENTPFHPRSPYAVSKLYAYWITVNYREAYGMFACNGILFNHESPRRGENFVTRKISMGVARIVHGLQDKIILGNLDAKRDWGYAPDYVRAMWLILQQDEPDDYVIATGETHSVREFVEKAFEVAGIKIEWRGKGVNEVGVVKSLNRRIPKMRKGKVVVEVSPELYRPADVDILVGDYSKAKKKLGWEPSVNFEKLVEIMVKEDISRFSRNGS